MREREFQGEITRSIKAMFPDAYYYKIPDMQPPRKECLQCKKVKVVPRPIKRPFDCELYHNGALYAFELKLVTRPAPFAVKRVAEHQIENLKRVKNNGGHGSLIIGLRFEGIIKAYIIDVDDWVNLVSEYRAVYGRKSIPINHFLDGRSMIIPLPRKRLAEKVSGWDMAHAIITIHEQRKSA